jgi:hypothetical protein
MFMFNIIQFIVPMIFLLVFGIIIFRAIKGITEWSNNNRQPVLTVKAKIVSKRAHTSNNSSMHGDHHHHSSSTSYYVTFEVESGDRMELKVMASEYGMLVEGDVGKLVFQGTRYKSFQREILNIY